MANIPRPAACLTCGRPLPVQHGKGRRRHYCDATCRSAARRARAAHVNSDLTLPSRKRYLDDEGAGPLEEVVRARERARGAEEALRAAVERARDAGRTWQELGAVLGTSRQAAFQRFGRPVDPRTGAEMARDVPPDAADRAIALLAELVVGRWAQVRGDFDEPMLAEVTEDRLASVWTQVAANVGRYERMGDPYVLRAGEHTVVNVPLHCEAGEVLGRVTFNADGTVGGLLLRPA